MLWHKSNRQDFLQLEGKTDEVRVKKPWTRPTLLGKWKLRCHMTANLRPRSRNILKLIRYSGATQNWQEWTVWGQIYTNGMRTYTTWKGSAFPPGSCDWMGSKSSIWPHTWVGSGAWHGLAGLKWGRCGPCGHLGGQLWCSRPIPKPSWAWAKTDGVRW